MKNLIGDRALRLGAVEGAVNCLLFLVFGIVSAVNVSGESGSMLAVVLVGLCCAAVAVAFKIFVLGKFSTSFQWYVGVLDTVPFMMHATDMDMNWQFMNKATEGFLGLNRTQVMGLHCSNWKAEICGTDRCSAAMLRSGKSTTFFEQNGMDIRVDTNWLLDKKGNRIGYVEVVQDISEMISLQNKQSELVSEISGMCSSFVTASDEISNGAQLLAQGSMQQTASVEELSAAMEMVTHEIEVNQQQAEQAASLAGAIQDDAEQGNEQMQKMIQAVEEITQASKAIEKVIKAIDDIAFQTNILALNAAVEAARAGQHGKGFAVVADEVRNLANKSAEAAKDTGDLIANSISKAKLGAEISEETASALVKIIAGIQESSQIVHSIAQSTQKQNEEIARINDGIQQVSMVVQQNSATAQQSAAASEELHSQTAALQSLLFSFNGSGQQPPELYPVYSEQHMAMHS